MGNNKFISKKTVSLISSLPYLGLADLTSVEKNRSYLKIILSRYTARGKILRLKRDMYTSREYVEKIQKNNKFSDYIEFIANMMYRPSYLSLDYILYEHNILSEIPRNFVSVSLNKTAAFSNELGNFFYHKIKKELFTGFIVVEKGDFMILKATKAKALFDFLYLRKNALIDKKSIAELRLNLENVNRSDWREFKKYLKMENSKKMKKIFNLLF